MLFETFKHCVDKDFWSSSSKYIFVPTRQFVWSEVVHVYRFFEIIKRLDVAFIYEDSSDKRNIHTRMLTFNMLNQDISIISPTTHVDVLFPDKLCDMNQYEYKIMATDQRPRLTRKNGQFQGIDVFFIKEAAKHQNATFSIQYYDAKDDRMLEKFDKSLSDGTIDLSLNSEHNEQLDHPDKIFKRVDTFDDGGYCALIPIPRSFIFRMDYLLLPFDWMTWMLLVISIGTGALVWWILKTHHSGRSLRSPTHMILRIIAAFFGQSIPFRHTRWYHLVMIQIFIFMMLILGSAYQSVLVSLLTVTRNATRITTVDEMLDCGYNYFADRIFIDMMKDAQKNHPILSNIQPILTRLDMIDYAEKSMNKSAFITRCDVATNLIYYDDYKFKYNDPTDYYYVLPEQFYHMYEDLMVSRFSPFYKRLQEIALRLFESGVKQYWHILTYTVDEKIEFKAFFLAKDGNVLKMADLKYIFYVYMIGMFLATIEFGVEILWHKNRNKIKRSQVGKITRKFRNKKKPNQHGMIFNRVQLEAIEL